MKIDALRIESGSRPGLGDRPRLHVQRPGTARFVRPADETVIGIDPELVNWPFGGTDACDRPVRFGRFSGLLLPGYGLASLLGGTALIGEGIGNLGIDDSLDPDDESRAASSGEMERPGLAFTAGRLRLTGTGFDGPDRVPVLDAETQVDIMQVALGGSGFADALQRDGVRPGLVSGGLGFAAEVISAVAHALPSLRPLLPYAKGVSVGITCYETLLEEIGRPMRIDAILG